MEDVSIEKGVELAEKVGKFTKNSKTKVGSQSNERDATRARAREELELKEKKKNSQVVLLHQREQTVQSENSDRSTCNTQTHNHHQTFNFSSPLYSQKREKRTHHVQHNPSTNPSTFSDPSNSVTLVYAT